MYEISFEVWMINTYITDWLSPGKLIMQCAT